MVRHPAIRDRIAAGILDTAASVLAERGESVSMADIAQAAGVGRATLYRYFPTREALLLGLTRAAFEELSDRIAAAELDAVPLREGVARAARAFIAAGRRYAAVIHVGKTYLEDPAEFDRAVAEPVRALIRRGVADGELRADVPPDVLFEMFTALLERALHLVGSERLGVEQAGAVITTTFLDGAGRR
ncbi:TetR/AcrR family transcriptional regulator [Jiangella alkaliphila]|uniref:Regulatory protein, tetR family n=1 Tax=Jiangella alkaliphila TaxID=419479 RepID=A0A1H2M1L5_9ACTN|nr:TetR/AcrR family transcriptional regulator [Jiangella alkaliphila]SDU87059.1 regulatory protein, tetR family [Jiangella alkaliphila]